MTTIFIHALVILGGYLLGSLASAVIVCKMLGLSDPRSDGSRNPGATNVLRLHGKQAAAITLFGDVLKGIIPVLIAKSLAMPDSVIAATGLAAFAGHLFPVFFGFKGGKGVATFIGVMMATHWLLAMTFIGIWLIMASLFRYSSLAALVATLFIPIVSIWLLPSAYLISNTLIAILVFWRHQSNIRNLMHGKEHKIGTSRD